jgi:hypothetical protein
MACDLLSAVLTVSALRVPLGVVALRRHAALVRALLEELEHAVPSGDPGVPGEVVAEHLMEELTRLAHRILDCAATMPHACEAPSDFDVGSQRHPLVQRPAPASSTRFKAASPIPARE